MYRPCCLGLILDMLLTSYVTLYTNTSNSYLQNGETKSHGWV